MISLSKLIVLVLVVAAVWFGWRWVSRVQAVGREKLKPQAGSPRKAGAGAGFGGTSKGRLSAEDMEKCPECGVYVAPASATPCGRAGCPYGRG